MNATKLAAGLPTPLHRPDWSTLRLKFLFERKTRPVMPDDGVVTAFRDGVVTLRSNRREDGFTMADKEIGYQGVEPADLVIHAMDGFAGAIGVSDSRGKCSPVLTIAVPRRGGLPVHTHFWAYYLRNLATSGFILSLAKGIRERSTDFRWSDASNLLVNFPDFVTQKRIADFLDLETARVDQLIEKKQRLMGLIAPKWEALIHESLNHSDTRFLRFGVVTKRTLRPVHRVENDTYIPLGLFNRGRGIFKKEQPLGAYLGDSDFYWIKEDDLILSGQFAWEGAVAYASTEEEGCVVSHRYPVYRGIKGVDTAYLFAYLRTKPGQFSLTESSRGSAGRNRPLNTSLLAKEKLPVPTHELQASVASLVQYEKKVSALVKRSIDRLLEYRSSLITAAVTGQIDVDVWRKRDETGRRLDAVEAGNSKYSTATSMTIGSILLSLGMAAEWTRTVRPYTVFRTLQQ